MKYYIFDAQITAETVQPLLDFIGNNDDELQIGICCVGGENDVERFLLNALNENKDRITLVAMSAIYSAAFALFYQFKGKRKITFGTRGMYHYSGVNVRVAANGGIQDSEEKAAAEFTKRNQKQWQDSFANGFMSVSELRNFRSGKDVYFTFDRIKQIFPHLEIIE